MSNTSDNSSILWTLSEEKKTQSVGFLIYLGVIMVLGSVGNAFVSYIYYSKLDRTAANLFVVVLSFCDFFGSIVCIPLDITVMFLPYILPNDIACRIIHYIVRGVVVSLALVVFAISVTRFKNVVRPQRKQITCPSVYLHISIVSTALCLPSFYVYSTLTAITFHLDMDGKKCSLTDVIKDRMLYIIFLFFVSVPVLMALCTIYILLGNTLVRCGDERHPRLNYPHKSIPKAEPSLVTEQRPSMNTIKRSKIHKRHIVVDEVMPGFHSTVALTMQRQFFMNTTRTTLMLSLVSLTWLFCFLPHLAGLIMLVIVPNLHGSLGPKGHFMICIGLRSFYFKNAANPWIYGILDFDFRQAMRSLLQKANLVR